MSNDGFDRINPPSSARTVRDTTLQLQNEAPTSEINNEYYAQNMDGKVAMLPRA
ncbi:uncharacterized protein STEHIDRAFT_159294 [Stereum hirsutum FP-91666 SS1]|uniref:uncharacterized protein n=1 Tax=Stereum hirsutum (strain FP-91666) TaxID=721885 RepID=UPI0004449BD7|nr:uncharacterized protein STEHIDRAFT_159294 [Stereum hirsutum FP-91666 SS1]EIM84631.1 hypothetical protein STEHIDRAFT_159294 [Stereum hirsutum FP-91666 SS1]